MLADGRTPMLRLMRDAGEPDLVARVRPGPATSVSETARLLAEAIPRRHTNRRPFESTAVPPEVLADLCAAAAVEGARLVVVEPAMRDAVLSVVRTAEHRRRRDREYLQELAEWTVATVRPARRRTARGVRAVERARGGTPCETSASCTRYAGVPPSSSRRNRRSRCSTPRATRRNSGYSAGQALERTLLTATVRGLASTLMTQPLELPQLRELFTVSAENQVAQVILRFGYGPPSAPSPRRPLESFLVHPD